MSKLMENYQGNQIDPFDHKIKLDDFSQSYIKNMVLTMQRYVRNLAMEWFPDQHVSYFTHDTKIKDIPESLQ